MLTFYFCYNRRTSLFFGVVVDRKSRWRSKKLSGKRIKGSPLHYPPQSMVLEPVMPIIDSMIKETESAVLRGRLTPDAAAQKIKELSDRFHGEFERKMEDWTRLLDEKSIISTSRSFNQIAKGLQLDTSMLSGELNQVFRAVTKENVGLFKTISSVHFAKVETAVMDSIISGKGLEDLLPFFESHNPGIRSYAIDRAMDQTRKAYTSLNLDRMKKAGIERFEWLHSKRSAQSRKLHIELSGQEFDIVNPPYIGDMYGEKIYGFPGQLPNCGCIMKPVY